MRYDTHIQIMIGPSFSITFPCLVLHKTIKSTMSVPSNLSKEFIEFVKAIGDSKTKQEEDEIVIKQIGILKRKIMDTKCDNVGTSALAIRNSAQPKRICFA